LDSPGNEILVFCLGRVCQHDHGCTCQEDLQERAGKRLAVFANVDLVHENAACSGKRSVTVYAVVVDTERNITIEQDAIRSSISAKDQITNFTDYYGE